MHKIIGSLSLCLILILTGCSKTTITRSGAPYINAKSNVLVAPFANLTETPDAGTRAKMIVANLLHMKGFQSVHVYQLKPKQKPLLQVAEKPLSKNKAISYAMSHHANYIVTGSVTEWRYKVGLDGEPSVGITMQLIKVPTGEVLWSAVGSKIGSSRAGLGQAGQDLLTKMVKGMPKLV